MTIKQAVILCGGKGTRLGMLTKNCPKPLLPVADRPFVSHLLDRLDAAGVDEVLMLVGPFTTEFKSALGERSRGGAMLRYIGEPIPAGTGGAIRYASDYLDDLFLMMNGDSIFTIDLLRFADLRNPQAVCNIALRKVEDTSRYGRVTVAEDGRITAFGEKSGEGPGTINGGIYAMKREILADIPRDGACSLETDTLPKLVQRGSVSGCLLDGAFLDIGTPVDFERADTFVRLSQ